MTPMALDGLKVEQHILMLACGLSEYRIGPGMPLDRLGHLPLRKRRDHKCRLEKAR